MREAPTLREARIYQTKTDRVSARIVMVTLDKLADRTVLHRRHLFKATALSTIVGTVSAYRGCNG